MTTLPGLIVILGSPNDEAGNLSDMGRGRVTKGFEEYLARRDKGWKILLTGGFGAHFNTTDKPNAYYAQQILHDLGVPTYDIVEFAESRDTVDDALQARPIIEKYQVSALVVVSSDFHLDRVRFIFSTIFPNQKITFSGSDYLASRPLDEQERLVAHEQRELKSLHTVRRSKLVGIALDG